MKEKVSKNDLKKIEARKDDVKKMKHELSRLEKTIKRNMRCYYLIGEALAEIKKNKLYKESGKFKTFEEYCLSTFKFSRIHGYRMINYYRVAVALGKDKTWVVPERLTAAFGETNDEKKIRKIWTSAIEKANGKEEDVTEKHIEEAVQAEAYGPLSAGMFFSRTLGENVDLEKAYDMEFICSSVGEKPSTFISMVKEFKANGASFAPVVNELLKQKYEELLAKDVKAKLEAFTRELQGEAPLAHEPDLVEDTEAKAS